MALIFCPKCGGKVSDKAYACVHCGYSAKKEEKEKRYKIFNYFLISLVYKLFSH